MKNEDTFGLFSWLNNLILNYLFSSFSVFHSDFSSLVSFTFCLLIFLNFFSKFSLKYKIKNNKEIWKKGMVMMEVED